MPDEIPFPKIAIQDSVFTRLFREKAYTFRLYRALHPEDTETTEDMIEIVTIENVLVNGLYNDLGFTVGEHLILLVEAQTTWAGCTRGHSHETKLCANLSENGSRCTRPKTRVTDFRFARM